MLINPKLYYVKDNISNVAILYVQLSQINKYSVYQFNPVSTIALMEIFSYAFSILTF